MISSIATPLPSLQRVAPSALPGAYAHCRRVTAEHARTFYFASIFLNGPKRNACYALYAFCRYVDDLADRYGSDAAATTAAIEIWRSDLTAVYDGRSVDKPVMTAWADVLDRYDIPPELPEKLIEGCLSDLRPAIRYETFDDLRDYCYNVASVVGLMTSNVFGYSDRNAEGRAIDLGIAMQLTNILRDVGEDARIDRIYLPQRELQAFGLDEDFIAEGRVTDPFRRFMRFQIDRARAFYASADRGIGLLDRDSRMTVRLMRHNYAAILDAIERNDYDVFSRRARISLPRKLLSVPTVWMRGEGKSKGW